MLIRKYGSITAPHAYYNYYCSLCFIISFHTYIVQTVDSVFDMCLCVSFVSAMASRVTLRCAGPSITFFRIVPPSAVTQQLRVSVYCALRRSVCFVSPTDAYLKQNKLFFTQHQQMHKC